MDVATFHAQRRFVSTPSGRIAYVEQGTGPAAVFGHGVPVNGFHWRHVMAGVSDIRRCIALHLMGLGYTEISPNSRRLVFRAGADDRAVSRRRLDTRVPGARLNGSPKVRGCFPRGAGPSQGDRRGRAALHGCRS